MRILHRWGERVTGEVVSINRCLIKDQGKRMFGGSDPSASYEAKCDYILSVRYHDGTREREKKSLIVLDWIAVDCGVPAPRYKEGMKVALRIHRFLPGRVVVDSPKVRQRQTGVLSYCAWVVAAGLCLALIFV